MNIIKHIKYIRPIFINTSIFEVFDSFRKNKERTFFPVTDHELVPVGIIREYDLKEYTYGMFGRELIRHKNLSDFITPCLAVTIEDSIEDIMRKSAGMVGTEGILVLQNGRYAGVLPNTELLELYERQRLITKRQLLQVQKMEAIGTLAGGIAHDFNNILTPIMGYLELMKRFPGDEERTHRYIGSVVEATMRAKELVGQILTFSHQREQERHPLHINPVVKEVMRLLRATLPSTIEIRVEIETENDLVNADATQIYQVLMNLCTNAAHAMRKAGGLLVVGVRQPEGKLPGYHTGEPIEGSRVCLCVSDTGEGIDPEILPRIFDPFFTTKGVGEGTGMGLAMVHGIVTGYDGMITVDSLVGRGTTFFICLPAMEPLVSPLQMGDTETSSSRGKGERVLFVDDEPMLVEMSAEALRVSGFTVTATSSSEEALSMFQKSPRTFDVVVTDQTMPALSGAELIEMMLHIRPDLPIIVCTGFSEVLSAERARALGAREYLTKPLAPSQLVSAIRRVLSPF